MISNDGVMSFILFLIYLIFILIFYSAFIARALITVLAVARFGLEKGGMEDLP